jgi:hypothetical protein
MPASETLLSGLLARDENVPHCRASYSATVAAPPSHHLAPCDPRKLAHRRQRVIAGLKAAAVDMSVVDPEIRWHGTFRRLPLR